MFYLSLAQTNLQNLSYIFQLKMFFPLILSHDVKSPKYQGPRKSLGI